MLNIQSGHFSLKAEQGSLKRNKNVSLQMLKEEDVFKKSSGVTFCAKQSTKTVSLDEGSSRVLFNLLFFQVCKNVQTGKIFLAKLPKDYKRRPNGHDILYETKFANLCRDPKTGWIYATRPNVSAKGGVVIASTTMKKDLADGKLKEHVIFMEFKRPSLEGKYKTDIEFPAGLIGDREEGPEGFIDTGKDELFVETGYKASEMKYVMEDITSSPGITDENFGVVLARNAVKVSDKIGEDDLERDIIMAIHEVPVERAYEWLSEKRSEGSSVCAQLYAALGLLLEDIRKNS